MILKYLKSILEEIDKKYKILLMVSFGIMVALGFAESIGIMMLIPLMEFAGVSMGEQGVLPPFLTRFIESLGIDMTIEMVLFLYVGIISFFAGLTYFQQVLSFFISVNITNDKKTMMYRRLVNAKWEYVLGSKTSDLLHLITTEVYMYNSLISVVLALSSSVIMILFYLGVTVILSWQMTLSAVGIALIFILLLRPINKKIQSISEKIFTSNRDEYAHLAENISSVKITKSFCNEQVSISKFEKIILKIRDNTSKVVKMSGFTTAFYKVGAVITISIIFYMAVVVFKIPAIKLFLFIYIFSRIIPKFSGMHSQYQNILKTIPSHNGISKYLKETELFKEQMVIKNEGKIALNHFVNLRDVKFSYKNSNHDFKTSFDVKIHANKTTAIIGHSGSGKTTLADIIAGLLFVDEGDIFIDDIPLDGNNLYNWRQSVSYMTQDIFLFNDTIKNNLLWAKPNATDEELVNALERASAYSFVKKFSQGLDTSIGDRGIKLSGGEKQRIALARALLKKPIILILDEATSALDNKNERHIQNAIEDIHGELTLLVIAHRLSTIENADQVVVMNKGHIEEVGTYSELLKSSSRYVKELMRLTA